MDNNKSETRSPVESKAAFAKRLGVNRSTITRAAQSGRIVINIDGKVLINESLARWESTKGGRTDVEARHAQGRGHYVQALRVLDSDGESESESDVGEMALYKARALEAKNKMALIEVGLEKGDLIEKPEHLRDAAKIGAGLRQSIENLIDNLSPQIGGIQPGLVAERIRHAVSELRFKV